MHQMVWSIIGLQKAFKNSNIYSKPSLLFQIVITCVYQISKGSTFPVTTVLISYQRSRKPFWDADTFLLGFGGAITGDVPVNDTDLHLELKGTLRCETCNWELLWRTPEWWRRWTFRLRRRQNDDRRTRRDKTKPFQFQPRMKNH